MVTPELLARKWGLSLEKAKDMLKAKTHECISSAVLHLTSRYPIYIISQRLRRIVCTFYTYALFKKQKYIIGNTCAQISTYGEVFVYVRPMQYKSQSVKAFNVVPRDIGVPNTLISYNTWEQAVP